MSIPDFIKSLWSEKRFHWLAAGLGVIVATWGVWNTHGVINKDGTLYIRAASFFADGKWTQGIDLYNWPFYSLVLAAGHNLTGLPFQTVGHVLAILFFALSSAAFVMILREAGGRRDVMSAGLLVFLASPCLVGDIVPMIVREHGFWAFLLWSLWSLMRFYNTNRFVYALAWGVSVSMAALFRIEGLAFLVFLPSALFFQARHAWQVKMGMFARAHSVLLVGSILLAGIFLINPLLKPDDLGRLFEPFNIIVKVFSEGDQILKEKAQIYGTLVLGEWLEEHALPGLLLTLAWALLFKIVGTAGLGQTLLLTASLEKRRIFKELSAFPVLLVFLLIGFANCVFILLNNFLIADRMTSPVAFAVQVFAAFMLAGLYRSFTDPAKKTARIGFLIVISLLAGQLVKTLLPADSGDSYEVKAVRWMNANKKQHERVFYDTMRLRYYAGEFQNDQNLDWPGVKQLFDSGSIEKQHYLVVHGPEKYPEQVAYIQERLGDPIMQFHNGRKNRVLVYRVCHPGECKQTGESVH
ncbi:MAG TPA: hypothetical protein PK425_04045 [Syntrophales bacterium]|nr:hypothetical protein [Syntrophales bacterium]